PQERADGDAGDGEKRERAQRTRLEERVKGRTWLARFEQRRPGRIRAGGGAAVPGLAERFGEIAHEERRKSNAFGKLYAQPPLERGEEPDAIDRVEPEIHLQARIGPDDDGRAQDRLNRRDQAFEVRWTAGRRIASGRPGLRLVTLQDLIAVQGPRCRA